LCMYVYCFATSRAWLALISKVFWVSGIFVEKRTDTIFILRTMA
jgi:hypothetical protein